MSEMHRPRAAMIIQAAAICSMALCSAAIGGEALPPPTGFLFWTPAQQSIGYRNIDKIFPTRTVKHGSTVFPLSKSPLTINVKYQFQGSQWSTAKFMKANNVAGLLVIKHGQ